MSAGDRLTAREVDRPWLASSTPYEVVHPAVTRLAEGTAAMRRVVADRPVLVAEALIAGVMPQQVAEAVGLGMDELRATVSRWATRLRQEGRLTQPNQRRKGQPRTAYAPQVHSCSGLANRTVWSLHGRVGEERRGVGWRSARCNSSVTSLHPEHAGSGHHAERRTGSWGGRVSRSSNWSPCSYTWRHRMRTPGQLRTCSTSWRRTNTLTR